MSNKPVAACGRWGLTQANPEQYAYLCTGNARRLPPSVLDTAFPKALAWETESHDLSLPLSASSLTPGLIGRSCLELKYPATCS